MAFEDREGHKRRAPVRAPVVSDYRRPARDWAAWRLDHVAWPADARVLDAGCGPGAYLPATLARIGPGGRVVALDLSLERVRSLPASERVAAVVGDVAALPLGDGSFDVALAMHMLYHVPDIPAAVAELRRVLRPGGLLVATTSGLRDQAELVDLFLACGGADPLALGGDRFAAENGAALLGRSFGSVEAHHWRGSELVVPAVEPVVNTFESLRYTMEPGLREGVAWADLLAAVRAAAGRVIARDGALRVREHTCLFVCR